MAAIGFALLAAPREAFAHLVTTGAGPYYDGFVHFFVSADDLAAVIALAIFAGLTGRVAAKRAVMALPAAWMAGAIIGWEVAPTFTADWIPAVSMMIAGLLAATNPRVPATVPAIAAGVLGVSHGAINGQSLAADDSSIVAALGIVTALGLMALLLGAWVSTLKRPWQVIAVRTLGSWTAALGLLTLAWSWRTVS